MDTLPVPGLPATRATIIATPRLTYAFNARTPYSVPACPPSPYPAFKCCCGIRRIPHHFAAAARLPHRAVPLPPTRGRLPFAPPSASPRGIMALLYLPFPYNLILWCVCHYLLPTHSHASPVLGMWEV